MIETHIPELNYILDGGFEKGVAISVVYPEEFDPYGLLPLLGKDTYNIIISFKDSYVNLETNLRRHGIPTKIDLFMDTISRSLGVSYQHEKVMFIDYPTLLNDISYELNKIFQNYSERTYNVMLYTGETLLDHNEEQSAKKFLEVLKNRTIGVGTFFYLGTKPLLQRPEYDLKVEKWDEEGWMLKGKGLISEVFFKLEPVFKIL